MIGRIFRITFKSSLAITHRMRSSLNFFRHCKFKATIIHAEAHSREKKIRQVRFFK